MLFCRGGKEKGKHMENELAVKHLTVSFSTPGGSLQAVRDVSFFLKKGETLALVGESGCGKSATVRAIAGVEAENAVTEEGEVIYKGQNLLQMTERERCCIRGNEIAMIFQNPVSSLNPVMPVGKQLRETFSKRMFANGKKEKLTKKEVNRKLEVLLKEVGITDTESFCKKYPFALSGGMCQRAAIAIALVNNPEILICDEPTTSLDAITQAQILKLIDKLKKERNLSVIFISHDLGVVSKTADRIAVMYAGKIVETGTCKEIFREPAHPYTRALLEAIPDLETGKLPKGIPGCMTDMKNPPVGDAFAERNPYALKMDYERQPPLVFLSPTHTASTWLLHEKALEAGWHENRRNVADTEKTEQMVRNRLYPETEELLVVRHLCKTFGKTKAVDDISFSMKEGEILGLVGESGCGKTTTARMLLGLCEKTAGSISFKGGRTQMQMIFQDSLSSLDPRMTAGEIVAEGLFLQGERDLGKIERQVREMLLLTGLSERYENRYPHELSGGERQRLGIARTLIVKPKLLVADEPLSALDVSVQAQIMELLKNMQERFGLAVLLIGHDLSAVRCLAQRTGVMKQGKLVELAETETLFSTPRHPYTKQLLQAIQRPY